MNYLHGPMTHDEIKTNVNERGYVTGIVPISLAKVIDGDLETFLDDISIALVDSELLSDVTYKLVGYADDNMLLIQVTGDTELVLEMSAE
jgi:hypothetical protein